MREYGFRRVAHRQKGNRELALQAKIKLASPFSDYFFKSKSYSYKEHTKTGQKNKLQNR
jgi:hypothetical protein